VRVLLDNNLSPRLVALLTEAGWDVTHVSSFGLRAAPDHIVLETALRDERVLVSADTDFGALLASSHATGPSVVLVRRVIGRRVNDLAGILIANLPPIEDDLNRGSIVVIGDDSVRIRQLPIG
jgi:predicted nuclease of predicted toxin-antitoxin system